MNLKPLTSINLIPLIDILFSLLFFFILSYKKIIPPPYSITLPASSSSSKLSKSQNHVLISILPDQLILLQNKKIPTHSLLPRLKSIVSQNPASLFVINADENTKIQSILSIFDTIQKSGSKNIPLLYTRPTPK